MRTFLPLNVVLKTNQKLKKSPAGSGEDFDILALQQ